MSTAEQLHADIVEHRQELAATVDALAHKLDVRARAADRLREVRPVALQAVAAMGLLLAGVVLVRRSRA
jgi:hypothetical protein